METATQTTEYNEINLIGYVKILLKRKLIILTTFGVFVLVAVLASLLMRKTYKIDTFLELGSVPETAGQLTQKIENDAYGVKVRAESAISEWDYPKIKAENPKDTNLVKMTIKSKNTEQAIDLLGKINALITDEHKALLVVQRDIIINTIARVKNKIASLEEEKKSLEAKVAALQRVVVYQYDPGTQFALFDAKEKLQIKVQEIENAYLEINGLQKNLDGIKPTRIIKDPIASDIPLAPNLSLNLILGALVGLLTGIFLAFFKEWWELDKKQ